MKRNNFKKILASILSVLLLVSTLTVLTACGETTNNPQSTSGAKNTTTAGSTNNAESTSGETNNETSGTSEVKDYGTLSVSFPTGNIRVAINILALQLGYFEEEGVTVQPVNISGTNALTAINDGSDQLDVLASGFVPDLQAIASGYDICFIAGTAVEGGSLIAKKGNASNYQNADTIIDIEAVTNAKLGLVRNQAAWVVTRQYLLDNGVSADALAAIEDETSGNVVYYADETAVAQAVQSGEVDIGFTPMEYALLYADAYNLEIITDSGSLQPNYVCCREATSSAKLAEKKDAFIAYETARIRAFAYYKQGETDDTVRADVVKIVSDYSGKEASYVETYLYGGVTKYSTDPNTSGIKKYVTAAYNAGALTGSDIDFNTYDISQNIDTSAYKTALDNLIQREPDNTFYAELLALFNESN